MDLDTTLKAYIKELEINSYPAAVVNRRMFTYNRFLDHYEELSVESVLDFYKANDFLRPHSYCLLHQDMLAWIRFMENQQLIGRELYIGLDRVEEEWMM